MADQFGAIEDKDYGEIADDNYGEELEATAKEAPSFWQKINTPLTTVQSDYISKPIANFIDDPNRDSSNENPILRAGRGFLGGAIRAGGEVGDALTSPLSLATFLLGGAEYSAAKAGLGTAARAANLGTKGLSTAVAGHGATQTFGPNRTPLERAFGVAEMAGGVAGMAHGPNIKAPEIAPAPQVKIPPPEIPVETTRTYHPIEPVQKASDTLLAYALRESPNPEQILYPREEPTGFDLYAQKDQQIQSDIAEMKRKADEAFQRFSQDRTAQVPAEPGSTRLGFQPQSEGDLPYPLNVVPNRVRPRTVQSQMEALTPERLKVEPEPIVDLKPQVENVISPSNEPPIESKPLGPLAKGGKINLVEEGIVKQVANDLDQIIPGASEQVKPIVAKSAGIFSKLKNLGAISIERQLEKIGPVAAEVRKTILGKEFRQRELFNQFMEPYQNIVDSLKGQDINNYIDSIEGTATPNNPTIARAVQATHELTNKMGDAAEAAGVRVKNLKNEAVPFKKLQNYWPRKPVNPVDSAAFIEELLANNPKLSRTQAVTLAKRMRDNGEIFSTSLHQRNPGKFGYNYRKDLAAMSEHIAKMSDDIASAEVLGPGGLRYKGSKISKLIAGSENPTNVEELARTAIEGRADNYSNYYKVSKNVLDWATKAQVATKLGMFPISNLNNQLQTILYGNLSEFSRSFLKTLAGSPEIRALAKEYGTASVGDIPVEIIREASKRRVPLIDTMISRSENFNRIIATGTGNGTAKMLFRAAKAGDRMASRRLSSLLLEDDLSPILKQNELNPEQLKFATQRFVELTQQMSSRLKLPPGWSTADPLLQIPLIFRKFAFQGTKSIVDAIKLNPTRNIPLFLIAAPMFGELTGDLKSLITGAVRGTVDPKNFFPAIAQELSKRGNFAGKIIGADTSDPEGYIISRIAADYIQSWGLGLMGDALQGILGADKEKGYATIFGPAVEQFVDTVSASSGALKEALTGFDSSSNTKELGREGLKALPVIGPGLQRGLIPYKSQELAP